MATSSDAVSMPSTVRERTSIYGHRREGHRASKGQGGFDPLSLLRHSYPWCMAHAHRSCSHFIVCKNKDYSSIAVSPSSCSLSTCVSSVLTSQPFPRSVACIGFTYATAKLNEHHYRFHHISHHDSLWQESRTHGRILQQQ